VLVRVKRGEGKSRWRRGARQAQDGARQGTPAAAVRKLAVQQVPQDADIPNEDHAIYNCECGFVFEADVSTSVGCPHCGRYQAW
jgi:hypothetical protein